MKYFYMLLAKIMGRNIGATPTSAIISQMNEKRELPMGRTAFYEWTNRLINGAMIPIDPEFKEQGVASQQFALGSMLMNLSPQTDYESDAYFIKSLRKNVINQVAHSIMEEIRNDAKARLAAAEEAKKAEVQLDLAAQ